MTKPQYAIMRFKKYKAPAISKIEAHNERTKEAYASNPDIDQSRTHLNYHLIAPQQKYRSEAESQITTAGCRVRKDSIYMVETLFTASAEFFDGKTPQEIRSFFEHALEFLKQKQNPETLISATVHLDEKTPHMHVCFVPLTSGKRLSAKQLLGNRKTMITWQDEYWKHMVSKYPTLERGESASETGRDHIPPRVFKQMTKLNKQKEMIVELLNGINLFNAKERSRDIQKILETYIPDVIRMRDELKKYKKSFTEISSENKVLKSRVEHLTDALDQSQKKSIAKALEDIRIRRELEEAQSVLKQIPPEIIAQHTSSGRKRAILYETE